MIDPKEFNYTEEELNQKTTEELLEIANQLVQSISEQIDEAIEEAKKSIIH